VIVAMVVFALALLMGAVAWRASAPLFSAYVFQRRNYRDQPLPTGVGVLIPLVCATLVGLFELLFDLRKPFTSGSAFDLDTLRFHGSGLVAVCVAFSFLGLIDDLGGVGESGGFRGHLRALFAGRLTTGMVKLAGGAFVALALIGGANASGGRLELVRDAALVCLAANLGNLLDRAPGRAIKFGLLAFALHTAFTFDGRAALGALPAGAAAGLLPADLREDMMIGDAGANALGAGLGFSVVVTASSAVRWWLLVVLLALNLASEVVSFSRVIDSVAPLRWFDRLGSRHRIA
jgi:hypothetical protein